jgi:hypothetical protein
MPIFRKRGGIYCNFTTNYFDLGHFFFWMLEMEMDWPMKMTGFIENISESRKLGKLNRTLCLVEPSGRI